MLPAPTRCSQPAQLVRAVALVAVLSSSACAEAQFQLADGSRRPKWFSTVNCDRCKVELSYYVWPWGRRATLVLSDANGRVVATVRAKLRGQDPIAPSGSYPSYEVAEASGTSNVIEHRVPEPRFYMLDDDAVFRTLGVPKP